MPLFLVMALPAAAAAPPPLADIDFDLARYGEAEFGRGACRRDDPSAIVVCAPRGNGDYPLTEMARIFEPRRIVAETRVTGNLTGNIHLEQGDYSDRGVVPNRIMFGLRLPF